MTLGASPSVASAASAEGVGYAALLECVRSERAEIEGKQRQARAAKGGHGVTAAAATEDAKGARDRNAMLCGNCGKALKKQLKCCICKSVNYCSKGSHVSITRNGAALQNILSWTSAMTVDDAHIELHDIWHQKCISEIYI